MLSIPSPPVPVPKDICTSSPSPLGFTFPQDGLHKQGLCFCYAYFPNYRRIPRREEDTRNGTYKEKGNAVLVCRTCLIIERLPLGKAIIQEDRKGHFEGTAYTKPQITNQKSKPPFAPFPESSNGGLTICFSYCFVLSSPFCHVTVSKGATATILTPTRWLKAAWTRCRSRRGSRLSRG